MQVNSYNFLRWDDGGADTAQPVPPLAYVKDRGHVGSLPILYPTEATSFYINTFDGVLHTFANMRLAIVNATSEVQTAALSTLSQHFIDTTLTVYNMYATFVTPALADGIYYLKIYDVTDDSEVLRSNYVWVRNDKAALDLETMYCKFRHDRYFYGIKYHEIPSFYQQFRLPISQSERQPESDREIYKEVTTGRVRTFNSILNRFYKFETYYFDAEAHEAASVMIEHSDLQFNGRVYTIKSPYREPNNPLSKLGKGEFEVYDEAFSAINRC